MDSRNDDNEERNEDAVTLKVPLTKYLNRWTLFSLYAGGILTFMSLICDPLCMKAYFSDNSLLPGLVQREYAQSVDAETYYRDMKQLISQQQFIKISYENERKSDKIIEYLDRTLQSLGMNVYLQSFEYDHGNFHHNYENNDLKQDYKLRGRNLYTIIRSERSVTSETLVLSVPYRASGPRENVASIALALSLANYFSSRNYWSKDLIILFADYNLYGISAWLDAYYDVRRSGENNSRCFGDKSTLEKMNSSQHRNKCHNYGPKIEFDAINYERSGPILAAINLELHAPTLEHIDIQIEGLNGQLPNLDLFNLCVEMAARETITPLFHHHSMPFDLSNEQLYMLHLSTVLSMMKSQASMLPRAAHGLFQKFAIQSLTLEGFEFRSAVNNNDGKTRSTSAPLLPASTLSVARMLEGVFRSLNNLIERFNRSYYFYLLASVRRFVPIGYYMIVFGLMTVPLLLKSVCLHIKCGRVSSQSITKNPELEYSHLMWRAALNCAQTQLHGLFLLVLPSIILLISPSYLSYLPVSSLSVAQMISLVTITYSTIIPLTQLLSQKNKAPSIGQSVNVKQTKTSNSEDLKFFQQKKCSLMVAYLNLALYLSLVSLINISLALVLSLALVPVAIVLDIRNTQMGKFVNRSILILVHPLLLSIIILTISNQLFKFIAPINNENTLESLYDCIIQSGHTIFWIIGQFAEQWYIFGNWAHLILVPLMFPIWLQFWCVT